jgi:hypothetical protein
LKISLTKKVQGKDGRRREKTRKRRKRENFGGSGRKLEIEWNREDFSGPLEEKEELQEQRGLPAAISPRQEFERA